MKPPIDRSRRLEGSPEAALQPGACPGKSQVPGEKIEGQDTFRGSVGQGQAPGESAGQFHVRKGTGQEGSPIGSGPFHPRNFPVQGPGHFSEGRAAQPSTCREQAADIQCAHLQARLPPVERRARRYVQADRSREDRPARPHVHLPLRQCQDQILDQEIFPRHPQAGPAGQVAGYPRQFQATRGRLEVDRKRGPGRHGSAGRKLRREDGASLSAKGELPGSDESARPAFPRGKTQPQPVDRENSLGEGHAQPGVRQREVLDVEQPGERRHVRRAFRLPGACALVRYPPRFQVPHPWAAVEEAAGDQLQSQVVQAQEIALARRTRDHESRYRNGRWGERYSQAGQGSCSAPRSQRPLDPGPDQRRPVDRQGHDRCGGPEQDRRSRGTPEGRTPQGHRSHRTILLPDTGIPETREGAAQLKEGS